jgi:hypothetical protein
MVYLQPYTFNPFSFSTKIYHLRKNDENRLDRHYRKVYENSVANNLHIEEGSHAGKK